MLLFDYYFILPLFFMNKYFFIIKFNNKSFTKLINEIKNNKSNKSKRHQ